MRLYLNDGLFLIGNRFKVGLLALLFSCLFVLSSRSVANEHNVKETDKYFPSCEEYFPNLGYISALKQKLEIDIDGQTTFPFNQPMYEIIWHGTGNIKAIIELVAKNQLR